MNQGEFSELALCLLRHKDIMKKEIVDITKQGDATFCVTYKTRKVDLSTSRLLTKASKGIHICENTQENLAQIVKLWKDLVKEETTIIMLTPLSGASWTVTPHIHQRIIGGDDVATGLKSIYQNAL